jgi:hypothetical protein
VFLESWPSHFNPSSVHAAVFCCGLILFLSFFQSNVEWVWCRTRRENLGYKTFVKSMADTCLDKKSGCFFLSFSWGLVLVGQGFVGTERREKRTGHRTERYNNMGGFFFSFSPYIE